MAEYVQVVAAGNQAGINGFRAVFGGADQSDVPQLQAWDNELGTTTAIQALVGTAENGNESFVCAASTNDGNGDPGAAWATGLSSSAGGAAVNRLRGTESMVLLGTTAPVAPFPVYRTIQWAMGLASDSPTGKVGHEPYISVKVFYTGAAPTVDIEYNSGTEGAPVWSPMTSQPSGTPNPVDVGTTIHATGPGTVGGVGSNNGVLDPVTKPGSGEKFAEEYWVRSL